MSLFMGMNYLLEWVNMVLYSAQTVKSLPPIFFFFEPITTPPVLLHFLGLLALLLPIFGPIFRQYNLSPIFFIFELKVLPVLTHFLAFGSTLWPFYLILALFSAKTVKIFHLFSSFLILQHLLFYFIFGLFGPTLVILLSFGPILPLQICFWCAHESIT